jgi:hypothetical protein
MSELAARLQQCQRRLARAALAAGRNESEITLLAVSKTKPVDAIRAAVCAGQRRFGESYVQEAVEKIAQLNDATLEWHFIGPIQSNKTRAIAEHFTWVQSIDRLKIAERLSAQRPAHLTPLQICIQVNISDEPQKGGIAAADLLPFAAAVSRLPGLHLRGLMAIPAAGGDMDAQRAPFAALRTLFEQLRLHHPQVDTLSMGMSDDLEAAVAEGSTLVRVGSAIFGSRA